MTPMPVASGPQEIACIQVTAPTARTKADMAPTAGQGLGIDEMVLMIGVSHGSLQPPVPCRRHNFGVFDPGSASATGVAGFSDGKKV